MSDYQGWALFDKVIIVAKREHKFDWNQRKRVEGELQGYIVDPSNKKMLESAINWGTVTQRLEEKDERGNYIYKKIEPVQYEFDNENFSLELLDCAESSSQGGKLSFWNCLVTKDEYRFKVGIAANLLLELLKGSSFKDGKCLHKVFFARCKGGVGMLHKDCQAYKDAVADMEKKSSVKSAKKTKQWVQGHNYVTLKEDTMYLYPIYSWVEAIFSEVQRGWGVYSKFLGYRKLDKPKKLFMTADTVMSLSKVSQYFDEKGPYIYIQDSLPSRMAGNLQIKVDMTDEQMDKHLMAKALSSLQSQVQHYDECEAKNYTYNLYPMQYVGLNTSPTTPPDFAEIRKIVEHMKLKFEG